MTKNRAPPRAAPRQEAEVTEVLSVSRSSTGRETYSHDPTMPVAPKRITFMSYGPYAIDPRSRRKLRGSRCEFVTDSGWSISPVLPSPTPSVRMPSC